MRKALESDIRYFSGKDFPSNRLSIILKNLIKHFYQCEEKEENTQKYPGVHLGVKGLSGEAFHFHVPAFFKFALINMPYSALMKKPSKICKYKTSFKNTKIEVLRFCLHSEI